MDNFKVISPSPLLRPYIKHYWTLEITEQVSERIIPTGCINMIFHRGSRLFSSTNNTMQPHSFICGHDISYTDLQSTGNLNMLVVVFYPHGASTFFKNPMNEFFNSYVSVSDLDDWSLNGLEDKVQNAPDNISAIHHIEQFLINRLKISAVSINHKRMATAIEAINNQSLSIRSLAAATCLSYKQFNRIFTQYVGINPKEFSRIVRFQRALNILESKTDVNLTQISYESGFSDQSHFIKEFKAFSGYTPKEFISLCNPHSDYFS